MSIAFPWWGEGARSRPRYSATLDHLLFAAACVQHRFQLRQNAHARWERDHA